MSQSIAISTGKTNLSLAPGEVFSGELTVTNLSPKDTTLVQVSPAPFSISDENYSPDFEDLSDYSQILSWLNVLPPAAPLAPGEQGIIHYTISIPATAPAGGQYFALLVSGADPDSEAASLSPAFSVSSENKSVRIKNTPKIASLFYVTVAGETKQEVSVLENTVKMFYLNTPITASSLVKNSSNVHVPVSYTLSVSDALSGEELYTNSSTSDTRTLLPDTKFFFEQTWSDTPALGLFKITQEISYLSQTDRADSYTFVCPIWFLVLLFAFFASVIFALFERIHLHQKRRSRRSSTQGSPDSPNWGNNQSKTIKSPKKVLTK